jgi:hypothetical protein
MTSTNRSGTADAVAEIWHSLDSDSLLQQLRRDSVRYAATHFRGNATPKCPPSQIEPAPATFPQNSSLPLALQPSAFQCQVSPPGSGVCLQRELSPIREGHFDNEERHRDYLSATRGEKQGRSLCPSFAGPLFVLRSIAPAWRLQYKLLLWKLLRKFGYETPIREFGDYQRNSATRALSASLTSRGKTARNSSK